jgi:hypothetical protein
MALLVFRLGAPATTHTVQGDSGPLGVSHSLHGSLSCVCRAIFRRLPIMVCVMFCTFHAHASTCAISSGAIESTIQSTLISCGRGNTATFAAGRHLLSSMLPGYLTRVEELRECVNYTIGYNDCNNIHRINYEAQATRCLRRYRSPK